MKKIITTITISLCLALPLLAQNNTDSLSYALGTNIGLSLKSFPAKIDPSSLCSAITDAIQGNPKMTMEESEMFLQNYFMRQQNEAAAKNKKAGEDFLKANKSKPGVVTLPSGIQYKIEKAGTGISPTENDEVEVHYRGTLIDGREFDSSYNRGESITFPLKSVIKGWTEGLQHAKEGGKIILYIPSDLAYGDTSRPGSIIEGGSSLIFEIELIKVIKNDSN